MSNSNKPIKIAYVQKLTNWAMLHGVHLKEMAKTSTIFFMKTTKSMVFWRRETCHLKKDRSMMGIYIF